MYTYTMPAEKWDELNPDKQAIRLLITKHQVEADHLKKLKDYYGGKHKILEENDRENKLVCNHAKDIADTASSYFIGNPVTYKSKEDITDVLDILERAGADEADGDNGIDLSVYGRAYEYVYAKQAETELAIRNLEAEHTFMVKDDSIEENELFAVYYYIRKDDTDRTVPVCIATVLTRNYKYVLNIQNIDGPQTLVEKPEAHYMGGVPVIEYLNNKLAIGDYELQIPLIDAYNALMSDRITDKEQFIDSILAIYGTLLADDDDIENESENENGQGTNHQKAMKKLKKEKLLEMPDGSKAEYLIRTFDEAGVEILKKAIEQDIHKFSHIPCLTDENFSGNVSGVAMEFKLLGLENITKIKSRYYKKGLRKRLWLISNYYSLKQILLNVEGITPTFTRALPKNLLEISQIVANLWGKVSKKTLLSQIPFVDDVEEELKAVEKEAQEAVEQQQAMFGIGTNTPPDEEESSEEDKQGKDVDEQ